MTKRLAVVVVVAAVACAAGAMFAADTVRFRGPDAQGRFPDTGLLKTWPTEGPKLLWSAKGLGAGFSSAVVAGATVYVTGQAPSGQGMLFAFGLDGKEKWKADYGKEVGKMGPAQPGSRGTPTVDGDNVYVLTGYGQLVTVEAKAGKVVRTVDLLKQFGGKQARYGFAESVLIDGDKIICTPGAADASLVAVNRNTGAPVWQSKGLSEEAGYCSPVLVTQGGKKLVVTMTAGAVVGVDADTGKVLWKQPHTGRFGLQPNPPLVGDGMIYITSSGGAAALELSADGSAVKETWTNKDLDVRMHGAVLLDGCIYGGSSSKKALLCVDAKTGKDNWAEAKIGPAVVVAADGMLYCYGSDGTVSLVKPDAKACTIVSQFKVGEGAGMHVAHPTIGGGRLLIRHGDVLLCYDIKAGG